MENNKTPRFWTKTFKWLCHDSLFEELQGDLEETFIKNTNTRGYKKARSIYRKEVLKLIRPSVIKPKRLIPASLKFTTFRMHFVLSLRSIKRNVSFTVLNVIGFAAAISVCLFIANIILTAYKLDNEFTNKENKYRISTVIDTDKATGFVGSSPAPLFSHLPNILPEAKNISGFKSNTRRLSFRGRDVIITTIEASPNFLNTLDYEVLRGSIERVISDPTHIAVSQSFADKYFYDQDIIGKQFSSFTISAIIESPQLISHLSFDWLNFSNKLDYVSEVELKNEYYLDYSRHNYVEVHEGADINQIERKLNLFAAQLNDTIDNKHYTFVLENLSSLGRSEASSRHGNLLTNSGIRIMTIFILIMAIIASINYTNLASAKAMHRLKEIGVRKIIGSKRYQIFGQFILETCLLGLLSLILGLVIYSFFARDLVNILPFAFDPELSLDTILVFIATSILVSILAGITPGIFISRISPLNLFKLKNAGKAFSFQAVRKVLLVIQLTITAFVFVFGTLFWKQFNTYRNEDMGLDIQNVYYLEFDAPDSTRNLAILKGELEKLPKVEAASFMSALIPIDDNNGIIELKTESKRDSVFSSVTWADTSILHTHKPKLELFNRSIVERNESSLIVNLDVLSQLNIPYETALGTFINTGGVLRPIAGVTTLPISSSIDPMNQTPSKNGYHFSETLILIPNLIQKLITVRTLPNSNALSKIEDAFTETFPEKQIAFRALEDLAQDRYPELKNVTKIFSYVLLCIMLITLMGQMGMALFQAETRTREIGVRKVLGASAIKISVNLIKGTTQQMALAILIATPIALYLFKEAAASFRNPIGITPQLLAVILIAFITIILAAVVSLTIPKARANPVDSLRNE